MKTLLIEDNKATALVIKSKLAEHGIEVVHVEYLSAITTTEGISVALLDLGLGEESGGLETIRLFRKRFPYLPVVVLSDNADERMRRAALYYGVASYFDKREGVSEKGILKLVRAMNTACQNTGENSGGTVSDQLKEALETLHDYAERLTVV